MLKKRPVRGLYKWNNGYAHLKGSNNCINSTDRTRPYQGQIMNIWEEYAMKAIKHDVNPTHRRPSRRPIVHWLPNHWKELEVRHLQSDVQETWRVDWLLSTASSSVTVSGLRSAKTWYLVTWWRWLIGLRRTPRKQIFQLASCSIPFAFLWQGSCLATLNCRLRLPNLRKAVWPVFRHLFRSE